VPHLLRHGTSVYKVISERPVILTSYDQFLVRGNLLTDKLMSQGFQLSRLQAAFRKFYGRYNDFICSYNLSLGHMLSDMFHTYR
jgi:hypothetical protein